MEITDTEQKQEKTLKKNTDIYRDLWDNTKHTNICPIGVPEEERVTSVRSLGWEDPLEKGKATHPSILAWRIPWTV